MLSKSSILWLSACEMELKMVGVKCWRWLRWWRSWQAYVTVLELRASRPCCALLLPYVFILCVRKGVIVVMPDSRLES